MNKFPMEGYKEKMHPDNPKGYIVASGCSLPTETPFENIHAMLDTVREIGYPVDIEKIHKN